MENLIDNILEENDLIVKKWHPIIIRATIPATTATFAVIHGCKKKFEFDYEFESIRVVKETTGTDLVHVIPVINAVPIPEGYYLLNSTNNCVFKASLGGLGNFGYKAYFQQNHKVYDFKPKVKNAWEFSLLGVNSSAGDINVEIIFSGYKIYKKFN